MNQDKNKILITEKNLGINKIDTKGLILVVDLDNTLVGDYFNVLNENSKDRIPILNEKLVIYYILSKPTYNIPT